ncbi:hypothetical protein Hanom_Chr12g01172521 [Helianthus anomalus]
MITYSTTTTTTITTITTTTTTTIIIIIHGRTNVHCPPRFTALTFFCSMISIYFGRWFHS